ncbi:hypothetical protein R0H07_26855, partial [Phytobacter diazotrophicus]|nr:hypothetical protein [Phytobacter diazotrophicus]
IPLWRPQTAGPPEHFVVFGRKIPRTPELKDIHIVSRAIAFAVAKVAQQEGVAVKTSEEALLQAIDDNFWLPEYRNYRRTSI